jgi:Fis1 C-terminal tetratricopeptide repeat/Fis1 N-terminal tetratricopeptide repeat
MSTNPGERLLCSRQRGIALGQVLSTVRSLSLRSASLCCGMGDSLELPVTDRALIASCASELAALEHSPDQSAIEGARLRLAWAMAHSGDTDDNDRAIALLEEVLKSSDSDLRGRREPLYLLAVALFNRGHTLRAKEVATEALRVAPRCKQSQALQVACEARLSEDALLGLAVGGVALAGIAIIAGALARGNKR